MAYKKLVKIEDDPNDKKFVYKGEWAYFTYRDEYETENFTIRAGEVIEKKKDFVVTYYNPITELREDYYIEDVVILFIEEDAKIRKFFDEKGSVGNAKEVEEN